jgi:hypothetical protein
VRTKSPAFKVVRFFNAINDAPVLFFQEESETACTVAIGAASARPALAAAIIQAKSTPILIPAMLESFMMFP